MSNAAAKGTHSDSPAGACSHQWRHRVQSDYTYLFFLAPALHAYTRLVGSSVKTRTPLPHVQVNKLKRKLQGKIQLPVASVSGILSQKASFFPSNPNTEINLNTVSK